MEVDVHVEVLRSDDGVLVGSREVGYNNGPRQLRLVRLSVAYHVVKLVP